MARDELVRSVELLAVVADWPGAAMARIADCAARVAQLLDGLELVAQPFLAREALVVEQARVLGVTLETRVAAELASARAALEAGRALEAVARMRQIADVLLQANPMALRVLALERFERTESARNASLAAAARRPSLAPEIVARAAELLARGRARRDVVGIVARELGCTPTYVRRVVNKALPAEKSEPEAR